MATAGEEKILTIKVDYEKAIQNIAEYKSKIDHLKIAEKELREEFAKGNMSRNDYNEQLTEIKIKTKQYTDSVRILTKEVNNSVKQDRVKSGSLKGLRAQLSNLTNEFDGLSKEERENINVGGKLAQQINEVTKEIKEAEYATQRYYRNVGNYSSAFDGLGMSIQQVARELPSLSMGFNTFFLAISNNLPILIDELTRAKNEYSELVKKGKAATPVWKQVVSSIFSWQTALVAAVTVLSMYGKDIINWVSNLFTGRDALVDMEEVMKDFSKNVGDASGEMIASVNSLSEEWKSLGGNLKEQEKFIKENKEEFDKLGISITTAKEAENAFVDNKDSLIDSIIARAKSMAMMDIAAEKYKEAVMKMMEADKLPDKIKTMVNVGNPYQSNWVSGEYDNQDKADLIQESKELEAAATDLVRKAGELTKEGEAILSNAGIKQSEDAIKAINNMTDFAGKETAAIRALEDALTDLIKNEAERRRKELEMSYDREIEDLKKRLQTEKDLTEKAKDAILATIKAKEQAKVEALNSQDIANEIANQQKLIQLQLDGVKEGTRQEHELRMQQLQSQREAELQDKTLTEQMKLAIVQKYEKLMSDETARYANETLQKQMDAIKVRFETAIEQAYGNEKEILRIQMEQRKAELDAIQQMEGESLEEFNLRRLQAENDFLDAKKDLRDKEVEIEQSKLQAMSDITGGLISLMEAIGEENKAMAVASKVLALAEIAINTGKAIAKMVSAEAGKGIAGLVTMATGIATILANIATAIKTVKSAKFATGGDVTGPGTGTSDSIHAMLSNGESVLTAKATSMFAPILSAMNQAGGGVPINGQKTGNQAMGEDMLARAFAKGVAGLPNPVVSVVDINNTAKRVEVIENINVI